MPDVLVVDDDRMACKALSQRLAMSGLDAVEAHSGVAAIQAFERDRPAVVLVDASMPDMSGFEVCASIRRQDPSGNATVVIVSGVTTPSEDYVSRCARAAGADAFFRKPYDGRELVELVKTKA